MREEIIFSTKSQTHIYAHAKQVAASLLRLLAMVVVFENLLELN